LVPFNTQELLHRLLTVPSDPTNIPALLLVMGLVPLIWVVPSLVLVTTTYKTEPEALEGTLSRVSDEVVAPLTVAPLRLPLVTAPVVRAVKEVAPGAPQYHW
jgi:hypothetical protein